MDEAILCVDLRRTFTTRSFRGPVRESVALAGINLSVPRGVVFGLLGPNGAGKTTTVRILSTLLTPTSGVARVLGLDVERQTKEVRRHIGFVLGGDRGLYGRLTAKENLEYFAALNHMEPRFATRRSEELLDAVGLFDRRNTLVEEFSRGMKQRLHIARGLLTDPEVVFMDEPTIGLDPLVAKEIREIVPRLAASGKTVLLTTHYMAEADTLCQAVALIDRGRIVAEGSPAEIKRRVSGFNVLEVVLRETTPELVEAIHALPGVLSVATLPEGMSQRLSVQTKDVAALRGTVLGLIDASRIQSLVEREPTLEEAYVSILG
ncbi:MAG: ATP-binding cassette domain-containing protein [Dehalococcoidia bacterium]